MRCWTQRLSGTSPSSPQTAGRWCSPPAAVRWGDRLVVHGSTGSRWLRLVVGSHAVVSVATVDGIIVARSAFESSLAYRSAVLFGSFQKLAGDDKGAALDALRPTDSRKGRRDPRSDTEGARGDSRLGYAHCGMVAANLRRLGRGRRGRRCASRLGRPSCLRQPTGHDPCRAGPTHRDLGTSVRGRHPRGALNRRGNAGSRWLTGRSGQYPDSSACRRASWGWVRWLCSRP